jgi:phage baseplate assembly protein W
MQNSYPYRIDNNGRTAIAGEDEHIKQMIEQVLFTSPGERVNRPTFGTGINTLIFAPLSDEIVATTQLLVQGALQQWLGDLIVVRSVDVSSKESTLRVNISYVNRKTQQQQTVEFSRGV